jgi:hypothetical protein
VRDAAKEVFSAARGARADAFGQAECGSSFNITSAMTRPVGPDTAPSVVTMDFCYMKSDDTGCGECALINLENPWVEL